MRILLQGVSDFLAAALTPLLPLFVVIALGLLAIFLMETKFSVVQLSINIVVAVVFGVFIVYVVSSMIFVSKTYLECKRRGVHFSEFRKTDEYKQRISKIMISLRLF